MRDEGYFPPGSMLRRVQSERAVGLLYGQRALMLGALNPVAFIGTTQRSKAQRAPWRRLTHTAEMFEAVFFGTRAEADRALSFTARLHDRVRGTLPEDAGPFPAGTAYSAFDPELMLWVVAPMYDSARVLHELLVGRLTATEREALWQDYVRFGELFGMPREAAPPTTAALDAWWASRRDAEEVFLTDHARAVGRSIGMRMPVPAWAAPPMRVAALVLTGSLPAWVRAEYGLSWTRADAAAFAALTTAARAGRPLVPGTLRRGSCLPFYGLVAAQERADRRAGKAGFDLSDAEPGSRSRAA
jgi:uncharacterized protein (DUF2236 family)